MFLQPEQTEVSLRPTFPEERLPTSGAIFPQVLWVSVMGLGKRGPSSHFQPASQPATQPALEQASQSFLKGL